MKTIETNKLIAEFMGGTLSSVPNLINLPQTRGVHSVKGSKMLPNGTYSVHRLNELKYHSSWDWLMPIVSKCRKESNAEDSHWESVYYSLEGCDIDVTYQSVVDFIKWYNEQNY